MPTNPEFRSRAARSVRGAVKPSQGALFSFEPCKLPIASTTSAAARAAVVLFKISALTPRLWKGENRSNSSSSRPRAGRFTIGRNFRTPRCLVKCNPRRAREVQAWRQCGSAWGEERNSAPPLHLLLHCERSFCTGSPIVRAWQRELEVNSSRTYARVCVRYGGVVIGGGADWNVAGRASFGHFRPTLTFRARAAPAGHLIAPLLLLLLLLVRLVANICARGECRLRTSTSGSGILPMNAPVRTSLPIYRVIGRLKNVIVFASSTVRWDCHCFAKSSNCSLNI